MRSRRSVLSLCLAATSCGPVIAIGTTYQSAVDERVFPVARPPPDFVDGSIAVGTSLGFQVRQMSREEPAVLFGRSTDESWLKGKRVEESVRVKLQDGGHAILIHGLAAVPDGAGAELPCAPPLARAAPVAPSLNPRRVPQNLLYVKSEQGRSIQRVFLVIE
jgi:hypothetical protein